AARLMRGTSVRWPAHMRDMSTFDEGLHPRGQAGKFTQKAKAGAGIGLADVPDAGIRAARAASERLSAMESAGAADPTATTAVAAYGLAALVRDEFPRADHIVTGECDEPDCTEQHVLTFMDANGYDVGQLLDMTPGGEDMAIELAGSIHLGTTEACKDGGYSIYDARSGTIDIGRALQEPGPGVQEPATRGHAVIDAYRATFDDLDLVDAIVARDMITDLFHWADTAGVDLDEVVESARQVADEERNDEQV